MTDNELSTELPDGTVIPVRRVGEYFIVAYDHIPKDEFIQYVEKLPYEDFQYEIKDVMWEDNAYINLGDEDGIERIRLGYEAAGEGVPITFVYSW